MLFIVCEINAKVWAPLAQSCLVWHFGSNDVQMFYDFEVKRQQNSAL